MQPQYPQYPPPGQPYVPVANAPRFAPWINRVGSYLIDWVPPAILLSISYSFVGFDGNMSGVSGGEWAGYVIFALLAFAVWFYNRCYRAGKTGKSWGKSMTGSRLIAEATGAPIGVGNAFLRDLCHILDDLCGLFPLGYLWPIWDRKRQTFADKIMKTVVILP